jgi:cellulose synthase/poly-beta-1,6-N-acetylglucosamine synthase-like glycosyltransferase
LEVDTFSSSDVNRGIDVLMVTYNRPVYTARSLAAVFEHSAPATRIWLWHNGNDADTLRVVEQYRDRLFRFVHSEENVRLTKPTNWLFENATGALLGKVDDDCIVPSSWDTQLSRAHCDEPSFGVLGCWRFFDEDFIPELAHKKIRSFRGGHRLLCNHWVAGTGYLMKRECVADIGLVKEARGFSDYCIELARRGWVNGWTYPFLYQEHMDDPRAAHTGIRSDEDLRRSGPLSAQQHNITTVSAWEQKLRQSARDVQAAPLGLAYYSPMRRRARNLRLRLSRLSRKLRDWLS